MPLSEAIYINCDDIGHLSSIWGNGGGLWSRNLAYLSLGSNWNKPGDVSTMGHAPVVWRD